MTTRPLTRASRAPGYQALIAEVVAGRVDTIVVRHIDRLWRDDLDAARGRALLRTHRVLVAEYGGMEYPMWTAHGQHMARTMSANGTFESDIKSERVREAAERRAEAGPPNGAPRPAG
jgi:DNA invertase Pin-like site-specific DNA recombinase